MPDTAANTAPFALLRVNTPGIDVEFLPLKPGRNRVGRGIENDICLNHPSVSFLHCDIEVGSEGAIVRDLGSTNGTFIDGERIREGALRPGQRLWLGEVELEWRHDESAAQGTPQTSGKRREPLVPELAKVRCASHPQVRAVWICTECQRPFCAACVKLVALGSRKTVSLCQVCDGVCERIEKRSRRAGPVSFVGGLLRALRYPLGSAGLVLLIVATALSPVLSLVDALFVFGGASAVLSFAFGVLVLAFLRQVILTSAEGEDSFPAWPELDVESLRQNLVLWLAVSLVCFGPWMLCGTAVRLEVAAARWACPVLLGSGMFYFPMAMLAVAIQDDAVAMNPILVCGSILRTARKYLVLCLFLALLAGAVYGVEAAFASVQLPAVGTAVTGSLSLYAALVAARAIGWFYSCAKDELGW